MAIEFPHKIFITGTDTGIGKTMVAAVLMSGLKGVYWKPVQSGLDEITDTEWVKEKTGLTDNHFFTETYRLTQPLSPHISAASDGIRIDLDKFITPEIREDDYLIVEGAGGIMVPLNEKDFMLDLMEKINANVLLVVRSTLGTINHTLLSLSQIRSRELRIMGVILNGPRNQGNKEAIEHYGKVRVLAEVEPMNQINKQSLEECFRICFKL